MSRPPAAPPEMLDAVREAFRCWNEGDIEPMRTFYAPDAELDLSLVFPDEGTGRVGLVDAYWHELFESWEGLRMEPVEMLDVGDGRFVLEIKASGVPAGSSLSVRQRFAFLSTSRDGLIVKTRAFPDVESALRAAREGG